MSTDDHPALARLIQTMATLRGPDGCPWDAEQTHVSLVPYLLEEVFELVEALEAGSRADIREELGDVLYQVLFHADIAAADAQDPFTIDDVAAGVEHKMRERHPHVFADGDARTVDEVVTAWAEIKAAHKADRSSVLDGIPERLPALQRAASVLKRSRSIEVEVPASPVDVVDQDQLGRILVAIVAAASRAGLDPEAALRGETRRLEKAIREVEASEGGP